MSNESILLICVKCFYLIIFINIDNVVNDVNTDFIFFVGDVILVSHGIVKMKHNRLHLLVFSLCLS